MGWLSYLGICDSISLEPSLVSDQADKLQVHTPQCCTQYNQTVTETEQKQIINNQLKQMKGMDARLFKNLSGGYSCTLLYNVLVQFRENHIMLI